ncbi:MULTISPECIES: SDR family NAD(P)-dependent oxidoreductase [Cupriavidus]|uniref:NAD-dependent epimerase/dehydratase:Short-chain dehydrogenase/reductase SDR n=1 Tax=Cupriavidus pinatubonensis (strain JMP 134 / LMG 1197) TaxID=264198 RepID=Q46RW1_CUPPJ|nr:MULTISPECIES: SDR family NAD(P)-dependent oxidoreductase [Cupriavidus]QYY28194.1 SDR family oxidoreductase [Cupriavidus pinatubonensis]TPQ44344.1 SDR family NAD(P)-dependent oxidoreductase [Cupriavidus pinatubonensis]
MLVENKVIIVTGAASPRGIGKATARALSAQGAHVVILDLKLEEAQSAAAELGPRHLGLACDVTDKAACERAALAVVERFGRIDGLVNNAGITQPLRTLDIQAANFDAVVDVNLRGTLYMSQAVLPQMKEQKRGSIVCMSSVSAQRGGGIFGGPHYSAAKAGVLGLARAMAREFGGDGIRVNSITPGLIQTDITGDKLTADMRADIIKGIPLGRLGDAGDVANACLFLASDLSSYLTGITLDVNGGMLIH